MENISSKILAIGNSKSYLKELEVVLSVAFPLIKFLRAVTSKEGLALCHREVPDIVLLDVEIPVMDGYEVCKTLKSDGLLDSIAVILITSNNPDREFRIKVLESGADAFLTKPLDKCELTTQIRSLFQSKDAAKILQNDRLQKEELVKYPGEILEKGHSPNVEESILMTENYFRPLIEKAPDGIVLIGVDGKINYASPSARRIFGYSDSETSFPDPIELTHPDDLQMVLSNFENLIRNPVLVIKLEYRFRKTDGGWLWVESTFSNQFAEPGIEAIVINFRDITGRKQAEERLRQSEILYRTVVETSPDGIAMIELDGTVVTANKQACQIFGFENEEDLKLHRNNFIEFIAPQDEARACENLRLRKNGMESDSTEYVAIRKDGRQFPIESKTSVVFDSQNCPYAIISVLRDITKRKKIEDTQQFLLGVEWSNSDEDFFMSMASYLANTLDMDYVSICRLTNDNQIAETLAIYLDGKIADNEIYTIKNTPGNDVVGKTNYCIDRNVCNQYPFDAVLHGIEAEGYIGTTLWSSAGKPIGLIALVSRQPMNNKSLAETVLNLVAIRSAGELERRDTESELFQSKKAFQNYFQNCSVGMSVTLPDKRWLEVNQCLCGMLGYSKEELAELSWMDLTYPEDIAKNLELFEAVEAGLLERFEIAKRFVKK
ncbi:MAG TPA: PAS domain S-box protein, partial [Prolixibacteraceae bacterium]